MPETMRCAHCGAEIPDRQQAYERDGKFYCTQACADAAQRQQEDPFSPGPGSLGK